MRIRAESLLVVPILFLLGAGLPVAEAKGKVPLRLAQARYVALGYDTVKGFVTEQEALGSPAWPLFMAVASSARAPPAERAAAQWVGRSRRLTIYSLSTTSPGRFSGAPNGKVPYRASRRSPSPSSRPTSNEWRPSSVVTK